MQVEEVKEENGLLTYIGTRRRLKSLA
ncbi:hypothetical protein ACNKHR_07770 [Shigella flexneri]